VPLCSFQGTARARPLGPVAVRVQGAHGASRAGGRGVVCDDAAREPAPHVRPTPSRGAGDAGSLKAEQHADRAGTGGVTNPRARLSLGPPRGGIGRTRSSTLI